MSMRHICSKSSKSVLSSVQEGDSQANAVDLRVAKIFRVNEFAMFEISNEHKVHRGSRELIPDSEGYWYLEPGHYEIVMENEIGVGVGEAGWVITRSTLNRNGLFITSGLYDSGYGFDAKTNEYTGGMMAGMLHVTIGPARIKKGTRVGQYLNFEAECLSLYDGDYGNHKDHDKKYK